MWQILPYLIKALFGHFMQYFLYNKNLGLFKFKSWKVSKSEISNDSNSDKESDETKNRKSLKKILFTANVFLHLSLSLIKKIEEITCFCRWKKSWTWDISQKDIPSKVFKKRKIRQKKLECPFPRVESLYGRECPCQPKCVVRVNLLRFTVKQFD